MEEPRVLDADTEFCAAGIVVDVDFEWILMTFFATRPPTTAPAIARIAMTLAIQSPAASQHSASMGVDYNQLTKQFYLLVSFQNSPIISCSHSRWCVQPFRALLGAEHAINRLCRENLLPVLSSPGPPLSGLYIGLICLHVSA